MANRFPLVFDAQQSKSIKELPNGDNLNLAGSSIVDAVNINISGEVTADSITVNTLNVAGAGGSIASVAISNNYNDLDNLPILFSGSYNDLTDVPIGVDWSNVTSKPTIPTRLSELENDAGFANEESLNIRADQLIGLAPVAISNSFTDLIDANQIVTQSQLIGNTITVEVTNTGDLVGSVFGADSTLLVDHFNNKVNADINTSLLVSNDQNLIITTPNKFPIENISIQVAQAGNIFIEGDEITLLGNVIADRLYGTFTGTVYSNDSTVVVNPETGDLNGKLNGEVDGNINKTTDSILTIQSASGIAITPNGDFNMPAATNIELRASNDALLSATGTLTLQSSSGIIEFNGSQIDASLTDINFANADLNLTGSTLNFLNATVNNLRDISISNSLNVTGTTTVDGQLTVEESYSATPTNKYFEIETGAANNRILRAGINMSSFAREFGPSVELTSYRSSPANDDAGPELVLRASTLTSSDDVIGVIGTGVTDVTNGNVTSEILFTTKNNGSYATPLKIIGNTLDFNGVVSFDNATIDWLPIVAGQIQASGLPSNTRFSQGAPATSNGVEGDIQGAVTFDSNYIYYCTATYTDGVADIWKRVAWSGDTW